LVAVFAVTVCLWALLVAFNALHATVSLAAIVAYVLGIGIASDANILSFERIRDELRKDRPSASRSGKAAGARSGPSWTPTPRC